MGILKNEANKTSEGRIFAILGKIGVLWLMWEHHDEIIHNEWVLGILLATLIAPKVFEKALYLKQGTKPIV